MDAPMNYHFTLDGFNLEITKIDEGLLIQGEHKESAQLFTKVLTPESVKTISQDSFFDLSTTYQVMRDYFEEKPEAASLSLTPQGKLTYNCKLSYGRVIKELEFEIQLEKKELDPMIRRDRAFNSLCNRIADIEKRINNNGFDQEVLDKKIMTYFSDFEKRLFDRLSGIENRLTKFEERIKKVEGNGLVKVEEKIQKVENDEYELNVNSMYARNFVFSNNNKTFTANSSSSFKPIFTNKPFPKFKTSKLSFRVENNTQKGLGFGIAPSEALNHQGYPFQNPKGYMYYSGGGLWKHGKFTSSSLLIPVNGDIVTFLMNTGTGELTVDINGKVVDHHKFKVKDMQSLDFYGFIYCGYPDGSVTLL